MSADHRYEFLKTQLPIDKNDLDNQMLEQHTNYFEASEYCVDFAISRDRAKEDLERTDARLYDMLAGKMEKPTEAKVRNQVICHPEHIEAFEVMLAAKQQYDRWMGMYEAYRQRASMLKYLTELVAAGYYSSPSKTGTTSLEEARAPVAAARSRKRLASD